MLSGQHILGNLLLGREARKAASLCLNRMHVAETCLFKMNVNNGEK